MRPLLSFPTVMYFALFGLVVGEALSEAHAADHFISRSISIVDCRTFDGGIRPGDTINLAGGVRGPLIIRNCSGTATNRIVIRNDASADGPVIMRRPSASSGGFVFLVQNIEHVVIDGTAGWRGSSGHCGWANRELGTNCGIQVTRTVKGDAPLAFLKFQGLFRNYTVRGLQIDGRTWGSSDLGDDGAGIGLLQVSPETLSDYPGYWRENIVYEQNYIHNTKTECMYIGGNWRTVDPRIPLRNITIQNSYIHDCGRNAITMKSAVSGANVVQSNYAARTGLQGRDSGRGGIFGYTTSHLAIRQNIVIESGGQCYGMNASGVPSTYKGAHFYAENNLGVRCGVISHPETGYGISVRSSDGSTLIDNVNVAYNTIVDSQADGIRFGGHLNTSQVLAGNNIITTPKSGDAITGNGTRMNNRTGSASAMAFIDPSIDNYQLSEMSPAINSGSDPYPAADLFGASRPQSGSPDQGAFEFPDKIAPAPPGKVLVK